MHCNFTYPTNAFYLKFCKIKNSIGYEGNRNCIREALDGDIKSDKTSFSYFKIMFVWYDKKITEFDVI